MACVTNSSQQLQNFLGVELFGERGCIIKVQKKVPSFLNLIYQCDQIQFFFMVRMVTRVH